jgi:hypothetical protein
VRAKLKSFDVLLDFTSRWGTEEASDFTVKIEKLWGF